jgi:hypothetical protein
MPGETRSSRPGVRSLTIVDRAGTARTFLVGREFSRLDNDREIATLLSQITKQYVRVV